jgi:hypothetical protein
MQTCERMLFGRPTSVIVNQIRKPLGDYSRVFNIDGPGNRLRMARLLAAIRLARMCATRDISHRLNNLRSPCQGSELGIDANPVIRSARGPYHCSCTIWMRGKSLFSCRLRIRMTAGVVVNSLRLCARLFRELIRGQRDRQLTHERHAETLVAHVDSP